VNRDVATIDGIVAAFYDVILGSEGEPRDWEHDRALYIEGVRFIKVRNGTPVVMTRD
jgi:hypothetical protein